MACLFVDDSPVTADLYSITVVALMGRHALIFAVAVPVVVPVHKRGHPLTGRYFAGWKSDSEYGLSLLTRGRENDRRTLSSPAGSPAWPHAWRCRYWHVGFTLYLRTLLIRCLKQNQLHRPPCLAKHLIKPLRVLLEQLHPVPEVSRVVFKRTADLHLVPQQH